MIFKKLCTIFAFEGICKHGQWLCRVFICVIIENSIITSANLLSFQLINKRNYNFVITFSLFIIILNNIIMETSVTQRIKELIKKKGETDTSFSKKIGISQSTLSCQMRSVKGVSMDVILSTLEAYPDISSEWLMRGKGSMDIVKDLPLMDGNETEKEQDIHASLAKAVAEMEIYKREILKLQTQKEYLEERNDALIVSNRMLQDELNKYQL